MKTRLGLLLLALAASLPAAQAQTGKWPEKPVRVVVPFPPGGTVDIIARMLTPRLSQEFGHGDRAQHARGVLALHRPGHCQVVEGG